MTYPNFMEDREGLDRWRETASQGDGHEMVANKNTVHRFVQTVDTLERALRIWLDAMEDGRSEPLFIARDHTKRLLDKRD